MTDIHIDNNPFTVIHYYGGTYTDSEGEEYIFTLVVNHNVSMGHAPVVSDIVWSNRQPDLSNNLEKDITEQFKAELATHKPQ